MGKNQSASNLPNIIKQSSDGSIAFMHDNTMLMQVSSSGAITTTGVISGSNALSASYAVSASAAASAVTAVTAQTASFANAFTVAGNLTAQTLVVQTITSSVDFVTGSTRFGSIIGNTHQFTGSMSITGSSIINSTGNALRISSLATGSNVQLYITNNNNGDLYAGVAASDGSSVFTGTGAYGGYIGTNLNVPFHFATNGTVKMTITGSNVGIGTTSPSTLLQVAGLSTFGASNVNGDLTIISNGSPFAIRGRGDYDRPFLGLSWDTSPDTGVIYGNVLKFNTNTTWGTNAGSTALTILANGKVGIGETTPDNTYQGLTIKGSDPSLRLKTTGGSGWTWIEFVNSSGTNNFSMGVNQTTPYFGIKAGAGMDSVHFAMDSSGNIGIGTQTPAAKLDVRGTSRFWHGNTTNYTAFVNSNEINHYASNGTAALMYLNWVVGGDVNIARNAIQAVSAGNVGIGEGANSIARLNVAGSTKMNRSFYNWYQGYWTGNSTYWHMKTSMSAGGSGNTQYTMSLFKGYMYSYSSVAINEGAVGFHNWSGIIYALATTGNLFTTVYVSSDGYVVLVIPSGAGETGVTIDWHQAYGYPFVTAQVTAAKLHGSPTGGY